MQCLCVWLWMFLALFVFCSIGNTYHIGFYCLWRFLLFELEAIPSWYRLLKPRTNRLSNSDVRITSLQAFSFQRSNDRSIQVKHPIKRNKTSLKKSINSESHLHFNSAFTYVGLNPSPRLNTYFSLTQWPTQRHDYWSKKTLRADCLNWLLTFIINPDEASFPCFARKAFEVS